MKLDLTQKQINALSKGKTVQLKHTQIGRGKEYSIHPENGKKLSKAYSMGKGARLSLSGPEITEMTGSGIFGKKFDRGLKKIGIKKAVFSAARAVKPFAQEALSQAADSVGTVYPAAAIPLKAAAAAANTYMEAPTKYQKKGGVRALARDTAMGQMDGSGIGMKQVGRVLKKTFSKQNVRKGVSAAKKGINEVNGILAEAGRDSLQSQAVRKVVKDKGLQDALINRADAILEGSGINPYLPAAYRGAGVRKPIRQMSGSGVRTRGDPSFARIAFDQVNNPDAFSSTRGRRPTSTGAGFSVGRANSGAGFSVKGGSISSRHKGFPQASLSQLHNPNMFDAR